MTKSICFTLTLICFFLSNIVSGQDTYMAIHMDGESYVFSIDEVQKITFDFVTAISENPEIATAAASFHMLKTYPNPMSSSTRLEYEVTQSSKVGVNIYDMQGQLIHTLFEGRQDAGTYSFTWDRTRQNGAKVSPGIFVGRVSIDDQILTSKIIVVN